MTILHVDFESFSAVDLKAAGLDNYAKDPSTGVHCMAYAFDDEPVQIYVPTENMTAGELRIREHIRQGGLVYAHNAAFEIAIFPKLGWGDLNPEQCRCTMAMAYAMGLPGKLENAAPALGIAQRKDMVGQRIMLKWCRPKADGSFWKPSDNPEEFKRLCDYCKTDVEVERAMHKRMMELSDSEQKLWALDYKINQNGILVDLPAIKQGLALVKSETARLNAEMLRVTGGVVGSCSEVQLLVKWIRAQGVKMKGVAKAAVLDALDGDLPPQVRQALELRKEAAKSSTAKLLAMQERAGADGRVRGAHQYHGAATGRWAGRGVQPQNMPRNSLLAAREIEQVFEVLGGIDD